jgi:uncharacterized membrane protein
MRYVIAYVSTAFVFLAADFIWLGFVARSFYRDNLEGLLLEKPLMDVAGLFYGLYVVGIVIFGVMAGLRDDSWRSAAIYGALFGLFAYATYDLTNLATLKNWPMIVSVVDMAWGAFVTSLAATGGYLAVRLYE